MSPPRQLRRRQDLAARKSAWGWRSDRRPASCGQFRPPRATARRSRSRSGDVDGDVANAAAPGNGDNEGLRNRILQAARNRGLDISCKWFGPVFRVTASVNCPALGASPTAVGYISGFTVPLLGYVHFDEMRVLNAELRKVENAKSSETASQAVAGAFGTGLLMGMFAMCTFRDTGCKTAELLAINDNAYQFKKLVRYYERMGFTIVREVGGGEGESPWYVELGDQLVWGGAGMLMRAQVDDVISQWTRSFD